MNDVNPYRQAFKVFGYDKEFTEVRLLNTSCGTVSGIFSADDAGADALEREISRLNLEQYTVYQVLNPLSGEYVDGKRCDTLIPHARGTAKDADIQRLHYIMTDFDPVRPAQTSSTEAEKKAAMDRLLLFLAEMKAEGMLPAAITDSGNGYNAYFSIDLPNTPQNVQLIKIYNSICHNKYSDSTVDFDRTVTNPSRLAKLPGTWAYKGLNTPERPYRQSKILSYQPTPQPIPKSLLECYIQKNTALSIPPVRHNVLSSYAPSGNGQTTLLPNPEQYIRSNGWAYRVKECDKGTMYILNSCPFNPAHNNASAFILAFDDGKAMFKCHHSSCADHNIGELLAQYPQ